MKYLESLEELKASLVGKKVYAYGWQRDNGGHISGEITDITSHLYSGKEVNVHVDAPTDRNYINTGGMSSMVLTVYKLNELIRNGKTEEPSRLLNTGTYIEFN